MPTQHEAVLFGGADASNKPLNDTWTRRRECWAQLHPSESPPANTIMTSALDSASGDFVVILYGSAGGSAYLALSTWLWNGQAWRESPASNPHVTAGQAAYDRTSQRVILLATSAAGGGAQTWAWDGSMWTLLTTPLSPTARYNAAMVADPATQEVLLFGGVSEATGQVLGDTWAWGGNQWKRLAPQGNPAPRQEATAAPFASHKESIVFGGLGSSGNVIGDAWQWDGNTWSQIPSYGAGCCSAAIDDGTDVVVFGGGSDHPTNVTRSWDGMSWTVA